MIANIHRAKLKQELAEGKINNEEYRKRKLLYCDEYEDGRINSLNIEIEEYERYYIIIDKDKHESHCRMKHVREKEEYLNKYVNEKETNTDNFQHFNISTEEHLFEDTNGLKEDRIRKK